jgi:alpha-1,6-mannosyltransferase
MVPGEAASAGGTTDRVFHATRGCNSARRLRRLLGILGIASTLGYVSIAVRLRGHPVFLRWGFPQGDFLPVFFLHAVPLFLLALAGAWWTFQTETDEARTVGLILGFGLLFRLLLLPTPPVLSSDIFRYVWDARMQASGVSPYLATPADRPPADPQQDPIYQQQNRPFARTIYPPLAQLAFRASHALGGESVTIMKGIMLLGDLCCLALLVQLLQGFSLPRSRVILYAWHPLAVFEVAGSGHVDALAIPFILLALVAWRRDRNLTAGVCLGAATLIKIYPILLLLALFSRRRWPMLLGCGAVIFLGYLPFLPEAGLGVLGHLPRFLTDPDEMFNPPILGVAVFLLSRVSSSPIAWASWMARGALLGILFWLVRRTPDPKGDPLGGIWVIAIAVTLLTPTLHPWYLLWLLPFLTIQPRPAWIYLSGAIVLSYLFYLVSPPMRALVGVVEYLPFIILLSLSWRRRSTAVAEATGTQGLLG